MTDEKKGWGSTPYPDPGHIDESLNEVVLIAGGLRVTFRLARLICLFILSFFVIALCFWTILDTTTSAQIDTLCGNLVVTIVTAWIAAIAAGGGMRGSG